MTASKVQFYQTYYQENITNYVSDKAASPDMLFENPEESFLTLESLSDIFHLCLKNFTFIKCMTVGHVNDAETSCYKRYKSTALQAHVSPKWLIWSESQHQDISYMSGCMWNISTRQDTPIIINIFYIIHTVFSWCDDFPISWPLSKRRNYKLL